MSTDTQPRLADLGRRPRPRAARTCGSTACRPRTATARRTWSTTTTARVLGLRRQALPELGPERGGRQVEGGVQPRAAVPTARCGPAATTPAARLEDMDRAGILASLCFPTVTRFCGQLFMEASDREFGLVCLKAYNDWMIEEWCGAAPGRYIPLILIPLWDPQLAVARRWSAARPWAPRRSPSPRTRPRSACPPSTTRTATGTRCSRRPTISRWWSCMHVGSSSTAAPDRPGRTVHGQPDLGRHAAPRAPCCRGCSAACSSATRTCKIALSEGEIGWMPYFLERAEQVLDKQRHWVKQGAKFMDHAGTDVDLDTLDIRETVPRPRLRLLHRRRPRHRQHRRDRRGQHHVRDRLPALRLDLARLHRGGQGAHRPPAAGDAVQAAARQRRAALPVHPGRAPVLAGTGAGA